MLSEMSWKEFLEWEAFSELDPFEESRQDYRIASVVTAIANSVRSKKQKRVRIEDALLQFGDLKPPRQAQTWQQQKAIAKFWASAFNIEHEAVTKKKQTSR